MAMSHMSHIVKINVFMICIFIVFKLVYFTTVNLDLHFKYKRIWSTKWSSIYMSCRKQMKWNISIKITPANFFYFGSRRFPLLRFRSALHCGYSGITDIQDCLFFVLNRARTWTVRCVIAKSKIFAKTFNIFIRQWYHYNHNAKRYENVIRGIVYCQNKNWQV
jgi:hypothetical protein